MYRFNSLELKLEVARFIKDITSLIRYDQSFQWSKDMIIALNEFLF